MRRRYFALGYVFFVLLTVTGLIMAFSFFERISAKPILSTDDLVASALSDTSSMNADPAYLIENIGNDLQASLKNFHHYPEVSFIEQEHRSNCLSCHSPLPHNKEIKSRAFLNMHGNFIACQTCHSSQAVTEYRWYDVEKDIVAEILPENIPLMAVQMVGINEGRAKLVKQTDMDFLGKYKAVQNNPSEQDQLCESLYRDDLEKVLSCESCHTDKNATIDWSKFGYTEDEILKLTTLSTPSVVQKYEEFYIPSF